MDKIEHWIDAFLVISGVSDEYAMYIRLLFLLVVLLLVSATSFLITKQIVIRLIYKFVRKSTVKWDDLLAEKRVFDLVAHVVPALFVRFLAPVIFSDFTYMLPVVEKLTDSYLVIVGTKIVTEFLKLRIGRASCR